MKARDLLLELWFWVYAFLLLPSWFLALLIHWRTSPIFIWIGPLEYARHSRATLNAFIASVCWFIIASVLDAIHRSL